MSMETRQKGRIDSLQALRALAFLGIFLSHAKSPVAWSALAVGIFFVMSGFLMVYSYKDRELKPTIINNIKFSYSKIKKLYPLHIITMLCALLMIVLNIILRKSTSMGEILSIGKMVFFNVTLTQTWVPMVGMSVSLNGVAWYLSVTAFLYFVFPLATGLIFMFVKCEGILTRLFNNKSLIWLGNISPQTFLIHYVIINYTHRAISILNISLNTWTFILVVILEFVITIGITLAYNGCVKKIEEKKASRLNCNE